MIWKRRLSSKITGYVTTRTHCVGLSFIEGIFFSFTHMGREHASREKKCTMVKKFIFMQKNVSRITFQEIKIRPLKAFEKMHF